MVRSLALILVLAVPCSSSAAELRITGGELAGIVQTLFAGTVIRLHHDGPPPRAGAAPAPGSMIQLGPRLGRQRFVFSVPAKDVSLGIAGRGRFVVNDVNSNPDFLVPSPNGPVKFGPTIAVGAAPAAYVVTLRFEDQGTEILGQPVGRVARLRGKLIPDVEVNSISLQIVLFPVNVKGGIGFRPSRVIFNGDIQAGGLADLRVFGHRLDLLDDMTHYKAELKQSIEHEVATMIDQNLAVIARDLVTEARRRADALGVRITGMRFEGTNLVITGTPLLG